MEKYVGILIDGWIIISMVHQDMIIKNKVSFFPAASLELVMVAIFVHFHFISDEKDSSYSSSCIDCKIYFCNIARILRGFFWSAAR